MDPHGCSDLLWGDGDSLILKQLLECEDGSEDTGVDHGASPVKYAGLVGKFEIFCLLSGVFLKNFTNNFKVGSDKWLNDGDTLTHYNPSYLHTSSVNRNISEFWHVAAVWSRKALFGITLMFAQLKKSCFMFVQNVLCLVVRQVGGLETSETSEVQSNARFGIT